MFGKTKEKIRVLGINSAAHQNLIEGLYNRVSRIDEEIIKIKQPFGNKMENIEEQISSMIVRINALAEYMGVEYKTIQVPDLSMGEVRQPTIDKIIAVNKRKHK